MARSTPPTRVRAPRTVIGTLDGDRHAGVDPAGRVRLAGSDWVLEWWVGAEDRWHVPAEEPSVRQRLVSGTPVVETRVRVPSGDAVHRAYGARDATGAAVIVVELENDSKVPFAVALAVRAAEPDGPGRVQEVTAEGTEVRVDGRLALVAGRAPGRRAAVSGADGDIAHVVQSGAAQPAAHVAARCPSGRAQGAVVFPLAHTATLRVVLPLGAGPVDVQALPTAAQVASGWRTHARRGARVVLPDRRLQDAFDSNVCHLLLRPHGFPVAAALSRMGFTAEAAAALLADPVATAGAQGPGEALLALAAHWSLTRDEAFADQAVPLVASLVAKLGKAGTPEELRLGAIATRGAAGLLAAVGQTKGAEDVRRAGAAMDKASSAPAPPPAPTGVEPLLEALTTASPTWSWASNVDGHDLVVGAALLVGVRNLLVSEAPTGAAELELSAHVAESWLGQGWEAHDLPTGSGRLSYAVRWHGDRPALLWELEPWPGAPPTRITIPGLDPAWSSDEPSGEALLAPVPIPERPAAAVTTPVELGRKPEADDR
jgi:hypothetical protein